jgi:hypothetical protein
MVSDDCCSSGAPYEANEGDQRSTTKSGINFAKSVVFFFSPLSILTDAEKRRAGEKAAKTL